MISKYRTAFILMTGLFFSFASVFGQSTAKNKSLTGKKYYSEEKALSFLYDYYNFYNRDEVYEDPKVRRVSNNVFYISIKYCSGGDGVCFVKESNGIFDEKKPNEFFWHSKVLVLTISSDTKYTIKEKTR